MIEMSKKIICKYCNESIIKPDVYLIKVFWFNSGKKTNEYYHLSCYSQKEWDY